MSSNRDLAFLMRAGLLALLVAAAAPLRAQAPSDRQMLAAWDDSLRRLLTTENIDEFNSLAKAGQGPARDVRRTMFQLMSGELRKSRNGIELALQNTTWDISAHSDWPWPYFALARTLIGMHQNDAPILPSS